MDKHNVFLSVYQLKNMVESHHPHTHYFDHDTLKFFGVRMSESRVLKSTEFVTDYNGVVHECYTLSELQHNDPRGARRHYHYFDINTLDDIIT